MFLRTTGIIIVWLMAGLQAMAQMPYNVIDLQQPNQTVLEKLTYLDVNKIRQSKKLEGLLWDEVLYRAAEDHAEYLLTEKAITHYQKTKAKRTPTDRVKIHGGLIYTVVGENIVEIPLGVTLDVKGRRRPTVTYESAAQVMADLWKASPGHYKNIISEKYNCTALAVAYDSTKQRLIAVQVFGYTATPSDQFVLPDYADSLLKMPIPKLPYSLKRYHYRKKNQQAIKTFSKLGIDRGYIYCSYKTAKKIFKGRRSGITQEFIPISQFDSTSREFSLVPNRRNGLYELNGELNKPVYRRKLLRYARKNTVREYFYITRFLSFKKPTTKFIYPLEPNNDETEFNVFLIKQKHLQTYNSYTTICGGLFDTGYPSVDWINSLKPPTNKAKFIIKQQYDTLSLKIFYASGKVEIDTLKQANIRKELSRVKGKIISVNAAAYASIEGNKSSNDQLAKDRLKNFMVIVRPWLDSSAIQPQLVTREQWKLFYKQVEGTPLQFLKTKHPDSVRVYVNQHRDDTLLTRLLNEERYMEITMIWRQDIKKYLPVQGTARKYDSLYQKIMRSEKPKSADLLALEQAQLELYFELSQKDTLDINTLPPVPQFEKFPALRYHELLFLYQYGHAISDTAFYNSLQRLGKSKYFPGRLRNQAIYNNLALMFNLYVRDELEQVLDYTKLTTLKYRQSKFLLKRFKKIKYNKGNGNNDYLILKMLPSLISYGKGQLPEYFPEDSLWKFYYLYSIHALYNGSVPVDARINGLLPGIKKYFHPDNNKLTDEERLTLAYFYCALYHFDTAKELIEPIALRAQPNLEALKLYITLHQFDFKDEHEFSNYVITQLPVLGKEEWCNLWNGQCYLNFLLLEDLKLKKVYNCNCGR